MRIFSRMKKPQKLAVHPWMRSEMMILPTNWKAKLNGDEFRKKLEEVFRADNSTGPTTAVSGYWTA